MNITGVHPTGEPNPPTHLNPNCQPSEPTTKAIGSRSPLIESNTFESVYEFPPPKPKPSDLTVKSKKSGNIRRFSDEIYKNRRYLKFFNKDLLEIHQIRQDLCRIWRDITKFGEISARFGGYLTGFCKISTNPVRTC